MPFDDTNAGGGGGGGPSEFERALAIIIAMSRLARPNFEPTEGDSIERIEFAITMRVSPDGEQFAPFGLMVGEWAKIEFEDAEDDPAKTEIKPDEGAGG